MTLGEYITQYRKKHELSGRAFAALANLSPQYISNLEKGVNNYGQPVKPTMPIYSKIAKATGLSEIELLSMIDDNVLINPPLTEKQMEIMQLASQLSDKQINFIRLVSQLTDQEAELLESQIKDLLRGQ